MNNPMQHPRGLANATREKPIEKILRAIQEIRYGSVEIVIHDSKIVQIERKEKIRVDVGSSRATS